LQDKFLFALSWKPKRNIVSRPAIGSQRVIYQSLTLVQSN